MCGRFSRYTGQDVIINRFGVDLTRAKPLASYNIAPSTQVSVVHRENPVILEDMQWGFVPFWADSPETVKHTPINARDDSLEKNIYKSSFENHRCIIPANGFYEWKQAGVVKQPYHITLPDGELMSLGGIYSSWKDDDREVLSFAIITTSPSGAMEKIHDRMPLILSEEDEQSWIDPTTGMEEIRKLVRSYDQRLRIYPVSTIVNSPRNDSSQCIEPIAEEDYGKEAGQGSLDEFF